MQTTEKKARLTIDYQLFHSDSSYFVLAIRHGLGTTNKDIHQAFLEGCYRPVHTYRRPSNASVKGELEEVFIKSQNFSRHWSKHAYRSTSVGDVIRVGKDYWIVAGTGFELGWTE